MADGSVVGVASLKGKVSAEEWQAGWTSRPSIGWLRSTVGTT